MHTIGVFDSGVGGLHVAHAIEAALPGNAVLYREDTVHVPYGTKPMDQIYGYVLPILRELVAEGADCIVVACNTVTTNLITRLRQELPIPLIGMEPMVKPAAAQTTSGIIAVCATPATLQSARYARLKQRYAANLQVLEPDCSDWASMIEKDAVNREFIAAQTQQLLDDGADVVVLGCTHYHWIEDDMRTMCEGRAVVLQPERPVITELRRVLARLS